MHDRRLTADQHYASSVAFGPPLLHQNDMVNQQKQELLTRMIRIMQSKARGVEPDGRPSHPKYCLLKFNTDQEETTQTELQRPSSGARVRDRERPRKEQSEVSCKGKHKRKKERSRRQMQKDDELVSRSTDTSQVSE